MTYCFQHALFVPVVFPSGIAPGAGSDQNVLLMARDGQGQVILRGSAIAGALRHAWHSYMKQFQPEGLQDDEAYFFGVAAHHQGGQESALRVMDAPLKMEAPGGLLRTHHLRNRHTGAVVDGGLFAMQAAPPQTTAVLSFFLRDVSTVPEPGREFLALLLHLLDGLILGGKPARGVGLVRIAADPAYHIFDLTDVNAYAAWLDLDRQWSEKRTFPPGENLQPLSAASRTQLELQVPLAIPRGQDLLIGDGQGLEHQIEPQKLVAADGQEYWQLPGASLRGLFRAWITRLAAREGLPVADSAKRHKERKGVWEGKIQPSAADYTGENLGWCFLPAAERSQALARTECPVAALFGSVFQAGRIHIFDAFAPIGAAKEQVRMHVAVDRITGGAAPHMLFDNAVLTASSAQSSPVFTVTIRIKSPQEREARWLRATLRALDLGLLRVGSSKASGRLALAGPVQASGPHHALFADLRPFT